LKEQIGSVDPVPSWLMVRYIALATERERMHGTAIAAEFLNDIGIAPAPSNCDDAVRTAAAPAWRISTHLVAGSGLVGVKQRGEFSS
jgi:hypothetical protein